MEPLAHQRDALAEITRRARAYYSGEWLELPVVPRWASLMVAPSGTGKTAVAAMAAAAAGASMLRVSAPNWMPCGANNRGTRETITVIGQHVAAHDRTMLVVDELDKIVDRTGDNSWKSYIRSELFDLADGRWPAGLNRPDGESDENDCPTTVPIETLTEKLRHTVYILGVATFQDWFDGAQSRRSMGFGAEINPEHQELTADIIAEKMPRELSNRFNSALIRLPELTPDDYHRIAREVETQLPLRMREPYRREVDRQLPGAIAAKKGVRFVEEVMLTVLVESQPEPTQPIPEIVKITSAKDLCTP